MMNASAFPTPAYPEACFRVGNLSARPLGFGGTSSSAHAFSVDIEDWQQSVLDHALPVSDRFIPLTERFLALLHHHHARATFFVLGLAARKAPDLIRRIDEAGHEIQSHGYDHTEVKHFTPCQFAEDLRGSKGIIEDIIGKPVIGYRAPRFSIGLSNLWALEVLVSCGFQYDSSIVPLRIRGYGIAGWPNLPVRVELPSGLHIIEMPVATLRAPILMPIGGGGYWRLLPYAVLRNGLQRKQRDGTPFVLYFHPHELDTEGFEHVCQPVPFHKRLHQGLGRSTMLRKMDRALREFRFQTMGELLRPHISSTPRQPLAVPVEDSATTMV